MWMAEGFTMLEFVDRCARKNADHHLSLKNDRIVCDGRVAARLLSEEREIQLDVC